MEQCHNITFKVRYYVHVKFTPTMTLQIRGNPNERGNLHFKNKSLTYTLYYTVRSIYYAYVLTKDIFVHSRFINGWCRNSENRNLPANVVNFTIIPFHRHG